MPFNMNRKLIFFALVSLVVYSCKDKATTVDITISPEAGTSYKAGDVIRAKVNLPGDVRPDSVVYLLDALRVGSAKDSSAVSIKTDSVALGARVITAKIYQAGKSQDITTNIVLLAAKAPELLTYQVEKVYPHDTTSYTEGLQYVDGIFYESAGEYKQSDIRKVDLNTGKVIKKTKIDPKYFGEGISVVGDKVVQLTWKEKVGFVYDKTSLNLLSTFNNNVGVEGWGMCFDGKQLYMDDSTNRIWFLDKDKYNSIGYIDVYDDKGPIDSLNELEYIDGKLYANVYQTNFILVINPHTGAVLQKVYMAGLYPKNAHYAGFDEDNNVLNGIAWDAKGKRVFVTGKKWPKLYQVKFLKK